MKIILLGIFKFDEFISSKNNRIFLRMKQMIGNLKNQTKNYLDFEKDTTMLRLMAFIRLLNKEASKKKKKKRFCSVLHTTKTIMHIFIVEYRVNNRLVLLYYYFCCPNN